MKKQFRGHCQVCGREYAVRNGIAHHGYSLKNGWFEGACSGGGAAPMEYDRAITARTVNAIRKQEEAQDVEDGIKNAPGARVGLCLRNIEFTEYNKLTDAQKREANRSMILRLRGRADLGDSIAANLNRLADKYCGQPLIEVTTGKPADDWEPVSEDEARRIQEQEAQLMRQCGGTSLTRRFSRK